jgi:hypothetical protein
VWMNNEQPRVSVCVDEQSTAQDECVWMNKTRGTIGIETGYRSIGTMLMRLRIDGWGNNESSSEGSGNASMAGSG